MPPWQPGEGCGQPFVDDLHLEQADIDTLVKWAATPVEGNVADAPTSMPVLGTLPHVDATVQMADAYTPSESLTDDYRCFIIDPQLAQTKFVTGYNILPGVTAEVHHVILYVAKRTDAEAADAADPGPGWSCFGGAGVSTSGALGVWAPGSSAVRFPSGTGVPFDTKNVIAMQVHYNTRAGVRQPDQTRAQLMFADRDVTSAVLLPIVADGFSIPPKSTGYSYTKSFTNTYVDMNIWGFLPHLHTRGKTIKLRTDDACLVTIPKWDFHWQRMYFRTTPSQLKVGQKFTLDCTWDNPDDKTVTWGESTTDEMCFAFVYATPK
jgi:hypothetical protein